MAGLSLVQEEQLAEEVRLFPILYDKRESGYKEKDVVMVAWNRVAEKLDFIEDGSNAQSCFGVLKKRYLRKRKEFKDSKKSGTSAEAMEKAEKNLKPYQFLIWLDNFIQEREGRIKLPHCRSQVFNFDSASIDTAEQVSGHSDLEEVGEDHHVSKGKHSCKKRLLVTGPNNDSFIKDMELSQMNSLRGNIGEKRKKSCEKADDSDDMFCKLLATELKELPSIERCMAKNELRNVIFKYQLAALRQQHGRYSQESSCVSCYPYQLRNTQDNIRVHTPPDPSGWESSKNN